ncbi:amidoligase family protein [Varunaivibrio sulfuroxidans]|uniref:amidoligase family protein n=2 Tax=Varunaivibrio sulfuroxidans TaxID=1773489 RepID=UPI0023E25ED7|nr:amidoligase family protein [Varunaivibrio sulfuroxidans]WES30178.1 amidoligase family protein [Varunaivibrio sulfuroxidans]
MIACYGGRAKSGDTQFVYTVTDTRWGDFRVELDTQVVHPEKDLGDIVEESALPTSKESVKVIRDLDAQMRALAGKASAGLVPTEIVSPPIPWDELDGLAGNAPEKEWSSKVEFSRNVFTGDSNEEIPIHGQPDHQYFEAGGGWHAGSGALPRARYEQCLLL